MQTFVLYRKFVSNDLLTVECLKELKVNLPVAHQFLAPTSFDNCAGVTRHTWRDVFESLFQCYNAYYACQVEERRSRMLAWSSSRGGLFGAVTVSLAEASGSGQATPTSSVQQKKGSQRKNREQGSLVDFF